MFKQYHLSRARMQDFLGTLASGEESLTLYIPPRLSPEKLSGMLKSIPASPEISREIHDIYISSPNGAVVLWGGAQKKMILPPFPIRDSVMLAGYETEHLKSLLQQDYTIGVVLIRLGSYGIGVCKGDKLISSKVGTGLVHGRHRQGGSSSHRFERHRDKQIETFFNRVCGHVQEQFNPYVKSLDYLVYGGAWETVQLFIKYCPLLGKLNKPVLPALSDTPEPRQAVLEKAIGRIWASTVYEWGED